MRQCYSAAKGGFILPIFNKSITMLTDCKLPIQNWHHPHHLGNNRSKSLFFILIYCFFSKHNNIVGLRFLFCLNDVDSKYHFISCVIYSLNQMSLSELPIKITFLFFLHVSINRVWANDTIVWSNNWQSIVESFISIIIVLNIYLRLFLFILSINYRN